MNKVKYTFRTLRKNLGFSVAVVLVLALGVGGTVSIFSIVNAVLLRPLPYLHAERLMMLWGNVQRAAVERRGTSFPDYRDWKDQNHSFDGLAVFSTAGFTYRGAEERTPVRGEIVGAEYFRLLDVKPALGRDFRPEEENDTALPPVVVVAHGFWTQRLGSDPAILGKQLVLDPGTYTVIGVMPPGFNGLGDQAEVWVPPASLPASEENYRDRGSRGAIVLGRLRPDVSLAAAQADMTNISQALERAYPATNEKRGVEVVSLAEETFGDVRPALLVLMGAVSIVLLIACANVANLILLRTETRQGEIAIRTAIGASRLELIKLLLAETLVLSSAGTALGLLVSGWAVDLLLLLSPIQLPSFVNVRLDGAVIAFAGGLAVFVALLMAVAPTLQFRSSGIYEALSSNSGRTAGARSMSRFRNAFIIGEVALSFVLLLTAGLFIETFRQLLHVDTGFEASHLLTLRVGLDRRGVRYQAIKDALGQLPGVTSVALSSVIPFSGGGAVFYSAEGEAAPLDPTTAPRAYIHFVTPDYFKTMGIPVRNGREFNANDGEQAIIVSEKVAKRFWPGQDPLGKRIRIGRNNPDNPWMNVIGVVGETKTRDIPDNPTADPDIYFTFSRFGGNAGVLVRSEVEPASLSATVVNQIKRLDKLAVISNVSTVEELMRPRLARSRFLSSLSGIFSGMALMLALVGIYGSIAQTVAHQTREIGIRMALGAHRPTVLRMVLGRSSVLIAAGLGIGFIASLFSGRAISDLLFGIGATAPSVFVMAAALMIITGLFAAYIPARRAARIDPLNALRQE